MEKIKLNYSILVSINKETILKICNAETNIVSFLMGENFRHLPIAHITKNEQALFLLFRRELVRFYLAFLKYAIHIRVFWFIDFCKAVDLQGWEVLFELFMVVIDQFSFGCYPGVILILTGISFC